jgi:serine/threonine-protein kinase
LTPERWQRIGALFDRSVALAAADRESVVRASNEPLDIQEEVLALLRSHESSESFLEPASLLEPGATVGQYRIRGVLGRGGMGVVYLAEDMRLHRPVALKALPPHVLRDEHFRSKLRQEARAAAALSHASIATVYALEEIDDHVYIATEYLDGDTLRAALDGGALPLDEALAIGRQLADALVTAHARGIVHRDLKPENIVRTSSTSVKILDFGLAQIDPSLQEMTTVARLTDAGTLAGTPLYMAPEQLLAQTTDARTDQFAFGVLMYELITGKHPFRGGSLLSTIARVLAGDPDAPQGMPDPIWQIISKTIGRKPEDRFESMTDVAIALSTPDSRPTPDSRLPWAWR